ncbi:cadherin domain-containing protein, partial [Aphelenchoides avenae]
RTQAIHIDVLDIDEPPAFLNEPKPFHGIVPFEPPIGFQVYKFNARDENGDGDDNVEYRLINTEPPGSFSVDLDTGVVRTALRGYAPGETYHIFVQARDRTPTDPQMPQESEIAVLELYAGDRPPQFMKSRYQASIREDLEVGS